MIPLNQIQVPTPCGEDWEAMDGNARRRFCGGCGCHVHDLSAMTAIQAQALLDRTGGRVCVRFQTRPDGTVLTQDGAAPVAERPVFWPRRLAAAASWALALALTGLGLTARADTAPHKTVPVKPKPHAAPAAPKPPRVILGKPRVTVGKVLMPQHTLGQPTSSPPKPPTTIGAPMVPTPRPMATMGIVAAPPKK